MFISRREFEDYKNLVGATLQLHKETIQSLLQEIGYLKGKVEMLTNMAGNPPRVYNNDTNQSNRHEELRRLQELMDAQVGQVVDGTLQVPRNLRKHFEDND